MKKTLFLILPLLILFQAPAFTQVNEITLNDIFGSRKFFPKGVYGLNPMKDGLTYCLLEGDSINVYNYETGGFVKNLVNRNDLVPQGDTAALG